ncbi:kinase domain protein (macronuclear) [Tetrahymena thermophila SB210]|uniref:MORN repeat-containing protein 3 n=1 Tax=Tetrahymena thermophila (strain SB210) TaxID=312017 RepID=Q23RA7_TETTS|nr:kinase domain protein [Tetrahymena thermophila SB210]EAR99141.2 kinase domain protein [Tetrahymena thermophila SB210]|eukprot:XP_001019386.2 kinase domain protein [Tetrahymena thermophila SB210]
MGKCISHITRKDWYKNCNKGCLYCFGYNCDMCAVDLQDGWNRCCDVLCFFCTFSCCQCQCTLIKNCYHGIMNKIEPCCSACGRLNDKLLKFCQNECDDMCECHCYCENPCIVRDVNNKQFLEYMSEFKIKVNFYNDSIFGEACILQKQSTGELFTVKVIQYNNENKFLQGDQQFKRRLQIFHPNIVNLKHVESFTEDSFCSLRIKNFLFFDFVLMDLQTEINYRKKTNCFFKEEELWNLIEGTLQALYYFYEIKLEHQGIRADRIYVSQLGQFKIADPYLLQSSNNFDDVKEAYFQSDTISENIFLSPDQFYKITQDDEYKASNKYENRFKSDIFSLGMIFLCAASLENLASLYNFEDSCIDLHSLNFKIENTASRYKSQILGRLLLGMLEENQDKRLDAKKALLLIQTEDKVKQCIIESRTNQQQQGLKDLQTPIKQRSLSVINEILENDNFHFQNIGNNSFEDKISNPLEMSRGGGGTTSNKQITIQSMQTPVMRNQTIKQFSPYKQESEQVLKSFYNLEYKKIVDGQILNFQFTGLGEDSEQIQLSDLGTIAVNNTQKTLLERLWVQCKESKFIQKVNCFKKKKQISELSLSQVKFGILFNENRDIIYEGNLYEENIKHGEGKLFEGSQIYIGNFSFDKKDGIGKITDLQGHVLFEGSFVNDKKEGQGIEYNMTYDENQLIHFKNFHKNWKKFEGQYSNSKKNGEGIYTYHNNHKFKCNFINNFADGEGVYLNEQDQVLFKAIYKKNKIQRVIQNFSLYPQPLSTGGGLSPQQNLNNSFANQSHHSLLQQDQVIENSNRINSQQEMQNIQKLVKQSKTVDVSDSIFK